MSKAAAAQHLKDVLRRGTHSLPVMFFGTLEVAWVSGRDTIAWGEGINRGLLTQCATRYRRAFNAGVQQVGAFVIMLFCAGVVPAAQPLSPQVGPSSSSACCWAGQWRACHFCVSLIDGAGCFSCFPRAPAGACAGQQWSLCRRLAVGVLHPAAFMEALEMPCRALAVGVLHAVAFMEALSMQCRALAYGVLHAVAFMEALSMQCRASAIHSDGSCIARSA